MKILYLTTVDVLGQESAQAMQISRMAIAFKMKLKNDFLLLSSAPKISSRFLRQLLFIIKALPKVYIFKPDIIYTRNIAIAWIMRLFGIQTIYEIHKPFETKTGDFIFKKISKKIKIVSISQAIKNFIIEKYNLDDKKILVAHDGVFLEDFSAIKEPKNELRKKYLGLSENDFVVLYQGSFQEGKGVDIILEVSKILPEIKFVLIGGSNPNPQEKYNNVVFLEKKKPNKIPYLIKSADILILPNTKRLPYWKFTSPLKMFDYMATEVPIIASDLGSIREVLNDKNSFLFNPENIDDLKEKILFIKNNYSLAQEKSRQALNDVKKYTWQERVDNILQFIA